MTERALVEIGVDAAEAKADELLCLVALVKRRAASLAKRPKLAGRGLVAPEELGSLEDLEARCGDGAVRRELGARRLAALHAMAARHADERSLGLVTNPPAHAATSDGHVDARV